MPRQRRVRRVRKQRKQLRRIYVAELEQADAPAQVCMPIAALPS